MGTFVLVPGAWMGGWAWTKVVPLLEAQGHAAVPVTLTGLGERVHLNSRELGIETAIRDVLNVIEYNDLDDVVLVGHSFAGKVVAAAADQAPKKVRTILYVDAFRPRKNLRKPQASFPKEFPSKGWTTPFPPKILEIAGRDIRGADLEWFMSKVTPLPTRYFSDPVTLSKRFDSVKSAYILCTQGGDPVDEILAGKWGELYGPSRVIDSGHWPMITKPEETVVDMLLVSGV
jgi:pimeloyl-ACP methyl ester carboxylesterase